MWPNVRQFPGAWTDNCLTLDWGLRGAGLVLGGLTVLSSVREARRNVSGECPRWVVTRRDDRRLSKSG